MPVSKSAAPAPRKSKIIVRNSKVHGRGVYAARDLKKGERIVEYKGERITWKEADRRPPSDPDDPHHTFFFSLSDGKTVIDAAVGGNAARYINHSCAPNCETEEDEQGQRVFVQTLRAIKAGEELNYDYGLLIDERLTPTLRKQYECRCGAKTCRGTMLALKRRKPTKTSAKRGAGGKTSKTSKARTARRKTAKRASN
ncbi:MAG: SET domain-containing protein [Betaproteobacteria bacterium]